MKSFREVGKDATQDQFILKAEYSWFEYIFFSYTGCLTKARELSLSYFLFIAEEKENRWIHVFLKGIKWKTNSFNQDLNSANFISKDDNHYTKHTFLFGTKYIQELFKRLFIPSTFSQSFSHFEGVLKEIAILGCLFMLLCAYDNNYKALIALWECLNEMLLRMDFLAFMNNASNIFHFFLQFDLCIICILLISIFLMALI